MEDKTLAARLADDLDAAFEALLLAHQDRVFTIAWRLLGDRQDAEEVAQDAFVRAYRALAGYDPERRRGLALRPWLATIVVNVARNRRRKASDRRPALALGPLLDGGLDPAADPGSTPEAAGLRREASEAWARRLLRCPPALRAAVVLRHVDGLSYEEISQALGRPIGTVKAQVHRGLAHLRAQLDAEQSTLSKELSA